MGTLKANVSLTSTDIFPVPLGITHVTTETIGGTASTFRTLVLSASQANKNLYTTAAGVGTSGIVYFYVKSDPTNAGNIDVEIGYSLAYTEVMRLAPGDFAYFPLDASQARTVRVDNGAASAATIYYFFAAKG